MEDQRIHIGYACPNHGFDVLAIDRRWCWLCLVYKGEWVKVEHVVNAVETL